MPVRSSPEHRARDGRVAVVVAGVGRVVDVDDGGNNDDGEVVEVTGGKGRTGISRL